MLIVGVGKHVENLGRAGYYKCPRCNNECLYSVLEISKKFEVFWIPIARWNKRYFLTCTICQYGYELKPEEIKDYLKN